MRRRLTRNARPPPTPIGLSLSLSPLLLAGKQNARCSLDDQLQAPPSFGPTHTFVCLLVNVYVNHLATTQIANRKATSLSPPRVYSFH